MDARLFRSTPSGLGRSRSEGKDHRSARRVAYRPAFGRFRMTSPPLVVIDLVITDRPLRKTQGGAREREVRDSMRDTARFAGTWVRSAEPKDTAFATWRNGSAERTGAPTSGGM